MNKNEKNYSTLDKCYCVSLEEMLNAREKRVCRQRELLENYEASVKKDISLICFTMNIAGPVKDFELAKKGFKSGIRVLEEALVNEDYPILYSENHYENTGYTAYYVVGNDAFSIKRLTTDIEDSTPMGRLFDIDVLILKQLNSDVYVSKIGRDEINLNERICLICKDKATVCARSRRHSVEKLQRKTIEILLTNEE